ncbi:MAG: hypothetical protein ACRC0L_02125, partial [Angustibacter sp.]
MCGKPKIEKPQQYQAAKTPVFNEGTEEDMAARRGRRGTILAQAYQSNAAAAPAAGKTMLGQ